MAKKIEKKVDFQDLELIIEKPTMAETGVMSITGNFDLLARQITDVVNKYKGTVLTDDNVNYVAALKKQFVTLRTGIEAKRKDWKKMYIATAENMIDAMCRDLQKIVAEGEDALGKQLDAYDQLRKDEITRSLNDYIAGVVESRGLRPEFASQIQLKKQYYNKTQDEADSCDDIDAQADDLLRKQRDYDAGVALIKAECEGSTLVIDNYLNQLQYRSAMDIALQIKSDRRKAEELYQQRKAEEAVKAEAQATPQPTVVGEKVREGTFDMPKRAEPSDEVRERTLWIKYKASQARLIQEFLVSNEIEFKFI